MIRHLITATVFGLGLTGVSLVGYLSTEPLAFTRPVPAPQPLADDRSPSVVPARMSRDLEGETSPVWLAEVRISGELPRAKKPVAALAPARFDPCSENNAVEMLLVDSSGASGVRKVRSLCAEPNVAAEAN